jgi:hypothetical protein
MGVLPAGRVAAELLSELLSTQHPVSTPRAHCMLNLPLERHVGGRVPERRLTGGCLSAREQCARRSDMVQPCHVKLERPRPNRSVGSV